MAMTRLRFAIATLALAGTAIAFAQSQPGPAQIDGKDLLAYLGTLR